MITSNHDVLEFFLLKTKKIGLRFLNWGPPPPPSPPSKKKQVATEKSLKLQTRGSPAAAAKAV